MSGSTVNNTIYCFPVCILIMIIMNSHLLIIHCCLFVSSARSLRVRGLQASAEKPEEAPESKVNRHTMRLPKLLGGHR